MVLDSYMRRKTWCWPSQARLATEVGCTRQTISRTVARLREVGILSTKYHREYGCLMYRINADAVVGLTQKGVSCDDRGVSCDDTQEVGGCRHMRQGVSPHATGGVATCDTNPSRTPQEPLKDDVHHHAPLTALVNDELAALWGKSRSNIPPTYAGQILRFLHTGTTGNDEPVRWPDGDDDGPEPMDPGRMIRAAFAVVRHSIGGEKPGPHRTVPYVIAAMRCAIAAGEYPAVEERQGRRSHVDRARSALDAKFDAIDVGGAA